MSILKLLSGRVYHEELFEARRILSRYFSIREGSTEANFLLCSQVPVDISDPESLGLNELNRHHDEAVVRFRNGEFLKSNNEQSTLIDIKREIARRMLDDCEICENRCRVNRHSTEGFCGVGSAPRIYSEFIHTGEEPEVIPSHTFFFTGCSFKCVFCQNWDISQDAGSGNRRSAEWTVERIAGKAHRSVNVNWVGGDPVPALPFVLDVLAQLRENIPQIWNSNMYLTVDSMKLLEGVVDLYLTDLKYGNNKCGERLSGIKGYWTVVTRNHLLAQNQCGLLVRHLVMPGHLECCTRPALEFLSGKMSQDNLRVNVMGQYRPEYCAGEFHEINRYPTSEEIGTAREWALELGLSLCR